MNKHWGQWIWASITKYINDNKGTYVICFEGDAKAMDDNSTWVEVRMDGPDIRHLSGSTYQLDVEINLLCNILIDEQKNVYYPQQLTGHFASLLLPTLHIYKYGPASDAENTGALLGCLQRQDNVRVTNYGNRQPNTRIYQFTVEAAYKLVLSGVS